MQSNNPCPWCKCNDIQVLSKELTPHIRDLKPGHQVECTNCGARGPCGYIDVASALGAWDGLDHSLTAHLRS